MIKTLLLVFGFAIAKSLFGQTGSEVYLADLKITKTGITLSNPKNITNRKGYDNQPFFHPDKPVLYFASFNDEGRADIKAFNFKSKQTKLVTQTSEREYSPTITPDKKFISCIIQRDNGAQDLGKYPVDGGPAIVLINNLTIGYHAWISTTKLALFVLGEPHTLRTYNLNSGRDSIVSQNIGRSLHKIPGQDKFSFVDKNTEPWTIQSFGAGKLETIATSLPTREDLAWTPDGKIIMSDGRQFFYFDTKQSQPKWQMFFASELSGVSRLAINSNGKQIAIVVSEE